METMVSKDKSFSEWARQICNDHLEILEHMSKSTNVLDRVIAKRIIQTAGVEKSD